MSVEKPPEGGVAAQARHTLMLYEQFSAWWLADGQFHDPDTDDVPWFDKRRALCWIAYFEAAKAAAPPAPQPCRWRPEVQAFADLMEQQLRANDHKPGWKGEDAISDLFPRLIEEAEELQEALQQWAVRVGWGESALYLPQNVARVGREAADVANFAMMIADVCGAPHTPRLNRNPLGGREMTDEDKSAIRAQFMQMLALPESLHPATALLKLTVAANDPEATRSTEAVRCIVNSKSLRTMIEAYYNLIAELDRTQVVLRQARWYLDDALQAYEHSDGRELLAKIDALCPARTSSEGGE